MKSLIKVWDLGRATYRMGIDMQNYARTLLEQNTNVSQAGENNHIGILILLEHANPTYTVGIRKYIMEKNKTSSLQGLSIHKDYLTALGAEYYETNRGGLITYHGPGQLVAYPILNLKNHFLFSPNAAKPQISYIKENLIVKTKINTIKWYIQQLADIMTLTSQKVGISNVLSQVVPSALTGTWYMPQGLQNNNFKNVIPHEFIKQFLSKAPQKIGAIGIRCSRDITSHGLALNCDVDLSWYDHIDPCGLNSLKMNNLNSQDTKLITSLSNILNKQISIASVMPYFLESFKEIFNCHLENTYEFYHKFNDIL